MKRIITLALAAVMLISLTGCGIIGGNGAETDAAEPSDAVSSLIELLEGEIRRLRDEESQNKEKIAELEKKVTSVNPQTSPVTQTDDTPDEPSPFTYKTENGNAVITGYTGNYSVLAVPEKLGGCPVTEIADSVFAGNTSLTSVTLPQGIKKLGWFVFSGCTSLKSAILPASLSEIGYDCFAYCTKMTVYCPSGSYAEKYAASYGIGCVAN